MTFRAHDRLMNVKPPFDAPKPTQIPGGPSRVPLVIRTEHAPVDFGTECDGCGDRGNLYCLKANGELRALCIHCHPTAKNWPGAK